MPDGTWWHAAKTTLADQGFVCPSLMESEIAPPEILEVARHDKAVRRNVLRRYKLTVVQPRALARDDRECDMAAQKDLLGFQLAVQHVFPKRVLMRLLQHLTGSASGGGLCGPNDGVLAVSDVWRHFVSGSAGRVPTLWRSASGCCALSPCLSRN